LVDFDELRERLEDAGELAMAQSAEEEARQ
jgi:hypothetical protein